MTEQTLRESIEPLADLMVGSQRIVVFTDAGIIRPGVIAQRIAASRSSFISSMGSTT